VTPRWLLLGLVAATPLLVEAERAYRRGDFEGAVRAYARAVAEGDTSAAVRYNLGTALLRLGRDDEARGHLDAAAAAADPALRGRAAYNAGHTDLEPVASGRVQEGREERLRRAIARYRAALRVDASDEDARWNLELAERLLRRDEAPAGGGGQGGGGGGGGPDGSLGAAAGGEDEDGGPLSPEEVERILAGAERRDAGLRRGLQTPGPPPAAGVRDW
jgi:tetratricopeptide (TPR) repeat protein